MISLRLLKKRYKVSLASYPFAVQGFWFILKIPLLLGIESTSLHIKSIRSDDINHLLNIVGQKCFCKEYLQSWNTMACILKMLFSSLNCVAANENELNKTSTSTVYKQGYIIDLYSNESEIKISIVLMKVHRKIPLEWQNYVPLSLDPKIMIHFNEYCHLQNCILQNCKRWCNTPLAVSNSESIFQYYSM